MKYLTVISLLFISVMGLFAQDEIWMRPNRGQWHENISYKIDIPSGHLFLEEKGFTYAFSTNHNAHEDAHNHSEHEKKAFAVKTTFLNANTPIFNEVSPSSFYENYFLGNDSSKWVTNSVAFNEIQYQKLYEKIDLRIYQANQTLKYDIEIEVGGNPSDFKVLYEGQESLQIIDSALHIRTPFGTIQEEKPFAYQIIDGIQKQVTCAYQLSSTGNQMSFIFPEGYDSTHTLIIDPELNFSTFTGSSSDNWGMTASPDVDGKLIGGGIVFATGYPTSAGSYDSSFNGGDVDMGITKFLNDGSGIVFSTYIGGSDSETPHSIIVNESNEIYIMGATASSDFPAHSSAYQPSKSPGGSPTEINGIDFDSGTDIYIVKLSPNGSSLLGSTFLGGNETDGISFGGVLVHNYGDQLRGEVFLDNESNVYISSTTTSSNFPIVGGDGSLGGARDAVVAKLSPDLSDLLWSSYIGGSGNESGNSVKVSSTGDVFVVGGTTSLDLPSTTGKIHPTYSGGIVDGYIAKFSAPAYIMEASYLGTDDYDQAYSVELDISDFVYVYGQSDGSYQTDGTNYINVNSGQFIHKISNDLTNTEWASVFGATTGIATISPTAFLVSDCYEIYVAGWGGVTNDFPGSTSNGFPTTSDAYQNSTSGNNFYIAVFEPDMTDLKYATYMGDPSSPGDHVDGGTSRFDKSGTIYHSVCAACGFDGVFPTTPGAYSTINGNNNCNMAAFQFELNQIEAVLSSGSPVVCIPDPVLFQNNSSTEGNQFTWFFGDGNSSTEFAPEHFYEDPGVYEVMLIASDAAGCYTPDTAFTEVTIAVFEGEAGSLSDTICPGSSVQLFAIGGEDYTWGPAENLDNPNIAEPIATITEETMFTVSIESVCGSTELEVTVFVYGTDAESGSDTSICVGDSTALFATGGDIYSWSPPENLSDPAVAEPYASPLITTQYIVDITTPEGCLIKDTTKIRVDQDIPYPNLIDEVNICRGDSIRITAGGANDYLWSPDIAISDPTVYNPFVSPEDTLSYAVSFTNACGTSYDTVDVNVIVIDATVSRDTLICPGSSAVLRASGGDFYKWSPVSFLSSTTDSITTATPLHDIEYLVTVSNTFGCFDTASVMVNLFIPPSIEVSTISNAVLGDTLNIWAIADGSILWTPDYNIDCVTCESTFVFPNQETTYLATVTDEKGCTNNAAVPITFNPIIYVPNAFTPDGDAFNNSFKAIAHNIIEFEMIIFNRWGEIVYTMNDLDDYWDATYKGSLVKDDVYVWLIKYKDINEISAEMTGHVVVLK